MIRLCWLGPQEKRTIVTHDVNTMTKCANERIGESIPTPGIIIVAEDLEIGRAIDDIEIVVECSSADDIVNQIQYLPCRCFSSA